MKTPHQDVSGQPLAFCSPTLDTPPAVVATPRRLHIGQVLAGRYEILASIGEGGMGVVYRAHDCELGEDVALKALLVDENTDPKVIEQFRYETKLARKITHPNVCRVYDLGESDGLRFLTMQIIEGQSLRVLLRKGLPTIETTFAILRQIAAGVAAAHEERVIHRDLKPENVLVRHDGRVFVVDFGLARSVRNSAGTLANFAGTPAYMSPEQLTLGRLDPRCDVFALGIITYEMFTGMLPFRGTSVEDIAHSIVHDEPRPYQLPQLPEAMERDLRRFIAKALAKPASDRFATAGDFAAELQRVGAGMQPDISGVARPEQSPAMASPQNDPDLSTAEFLQAQAIVPSVAHAHPTVEENVDITTPLGQTDVVVTVQDKPLVPPATDVPLVSMSKLADPPRRSRLRTWPLAALVVPVALVGLLGAWAFRDHPPTNAVASAVVASNEAPKLEPWTVVILPLRHSTGKPEGDTVARYATSRLGSAIASIPGINVREVATPPGSMQVPSPVWIMHGAVDRIADEWKVSVVFEEMGTNLRSEQITVGGSEAHTEQWLNDLTLHVVDEVRFMVHGRKWQEFAAQGTENDVARDKLLAYHAMVGPGPRREHFDVGLRMLDEVVSMDPNYAAALVERAFLRAKGAGAGSNEERMKASVRDIDAAMRIAPDHAITRVMKCHVLQMAAESVDRPTDESIQKAIDACGNALAVDGSSARVRIAMARLADRQCRDDEAMQLLESSLEHDRSYWGRAMKHLVTLAFHNERLELADRISVRLVAFQNEEQQRGSRAPSRRAGLAATKGAHFLRGAVLLRLGKYDEAEKAFRDEIATLSEKDHQKWAEAASLHALVMIAQRAGKEPNPEVVRRLERLETEHRVRSDSDGARALASAYALVDPRAALGWIERMQAPTSCDAAVAQALVYHAAGENRRAKDALASCRPEMQWEKSCVASLRPHLEK